MPKVLYEQFSQFFNLYFLVVALSQLFPPLQIGLLFTYIAPLAFVLAVTMCKEGFDDYKRYRTDREINTELYTRLTPGGGDVTVAAQDISVGHVLRVKPRSRRAHCAGLAGADARPSASLALGACQPARACRPAAAAHQGVVRHPLPAHGPARRRGGGWELRLARDQPTEGEPVVNRRDGLEAAPRRAKLPEAFLGRGEPLEGSGGWQTAGL